MAATLKDVALRAEVSVAAASLVLSGKAEGRVADATAERVRAAASELGYRGNRAARSLRRQSAPLLGLLSLGVATLPYAGAMLEAAQSAAREHDYDLLFIEVGTPHDVGTPDAIAENLLLLQEHQVAGILIASYFHRELVLPAQLPAPTVLVDALCPDRDIDWVVPDEYVGESGVLEELARAGHHHVGWICETPTYPATRLRTKAFDDVAARHGWDDDPRRVVLAEHADAADGYAAMLRLLEQFPKVTAVAAFTDRMAMGVYMACFERGIRVPQDMSIVGFDDQVLVSEALRPGLTTVALPHRQMGKWAVGRLIERIESAQDLGVSQVHINGGLVVRDSVAAPRTGRIRASARR
ncbi:LacI family DNA-binding transcriptional regulator [Nonomuraea guangzhouensis]|uniref:LacI family DNA-binding transcriptional regulator n=1 Tax=Nonomuraea guangzhouensis TaxID=1291555 RepID=A0ABW4G3E7_9ACTN|nr:LacI family DNA-binding transcriptional regulator [Nonomuraea guangzhouensis]